VSAAGPTTRRWALKLEYDGVRYVGWQRQATGLSIQEVVETSAAKLAGGMPVVCHVAGRTDAGVHAEGQVASVDLPEPGRGVWSPERLRDALNFHLKPHPIVAVTASPVPSAWHPRFDAIMRAYRYQILNRRARPAFRIGQVWHVERLLDVDAMRNASRCLLGRHDFTTFRATSCQAKGPVRTLDQLDLSRDGEVITIKVEARSFLHHQVRNIVGTLALVGSGRWPIEQVAVALAARDRRSGGPTAPPDGLSLIKVGYPIDPFSAV
jgi:tRNA pseudouridine38-40 synthase